MISFKHGSWILLTALTAGQVRAANPRVLRADAPSTAKLGRPAWLLGSFLRLSEEQPRRLIRIGEKLFANERLRITTMEPSYAFDWQNRVAMASALSQIFDPSVAQSKALGSDSITIRQRARKILKAALMEDPSLLVRDSAVESIRRIVRMKPTEGKYWQKSLEKSFMDSRNHVEGEGLFIRETILTALREASLNPSRKMRRMAEVDLNPQVRDLLKSWRTSAYEDIESN